MPNQQLLEIASQGRSTLAPNALTGPQAKLYSQRLRLDMGQQGLSSFSAQDTENHVDDALLLIQCGLIEYRESPSSDSWKVAFKRAAELFEWTSHVRLRPKHSPLSFLSAAAYQAAGFPAMAMGVLLRMPSDERYSAILREFLRANFPATLRSTFEFWKETHNSVNELQSDLIVQTFRHVIMCIGSIAYCLKVGNEDGLSRAIIKLDKLSSTMSLSTDPYSYILAKLTSITAQRFASQSLWPHITRLSTSANDETKDALIQYARSSFNNRRALVWPAQDTGLRKLADRNSFVLCTPTGSGKTSVATVAIVQELFSDTRDASGASVPNLILYLVPSRALAAEVESRLGQDLAGIAARPITVTGLYGGIDWGPTDAWIQSSSATILICTFEKADALVRYLGVLFLHRVKLIVIDEAHNVESDRQSSQDFSTSRSLRLEQLGTRIANARELFQFRIIALSAVAAQAAPALGRWLSNNAQNNPVTSNYRSTRQMLGRLVVSSNGRFIIYYDRSDGQSLSFEDNHRNNVPYVESPIPAVPGGVDFDEGPEKCMRAPIIWAAIQLARDREDGAKPTVLISITQRVEIFAEAALVFVDEWQNLSLPRYYGDRNDPHYIACLASARDYFSENSIEYKLLNHGIAVHHGKMPSILARRLKILIDKGIIRVVIATSTLSEGVNIPVNYLLIPSLFRATDPITIQQFSNLIGRAGRPGVATEGSALLVIPDSPRRNRRQLTAYAELLAQLTPRASDAIQDNASSPLLTLLTTIEEVWRQLAPRGTEFEFHDWLEQTVVVPDGSQQMSHLDSLDAFLLAAIHEVELLRNSEIEPDQMETELIRIWQKTYAFSSLQIQSRMERIFIARGKTIKRRYPDPNFRRRVYRTGLNPTSANVLFDRTQEIVNKLREGDAYSRWNTEERLTFICDVFELLSEVPSFRISSKLGARSNFSEWRKLIRWWFAKDKLPVQPLPKEITIWFDYVSQNFIYRGAWGLGALIGVMLDLDANGQPIRAIELDDWPRSGLPWIAFWLKELITWGTLDPVAAFLLARNLALDRPNAASAALAYYATLQIDTSANDILDPRSIRRWIAENFPPVQQRIAPIGSMPISVRLLRPPQDYSIRRIGVRAMELQGGLLWIDSAGYRVAESGRPEGWSVSDQITYELYVDQALIQSHLYRPYE